MAHCDVKPPNMGIQRGTNKLVLLDADDLTKFGYKRRVATKGQNITYEDFARIGSLICDERTDAMGFEFCKTFIEKATREIASPLIKFGELYTKCAGATVLEAVDVVFLLDLTGSMSCWIT